MSAADLISKTDASQMTADEVRRRAAPVLVANPRLTVNGWYVGRLPAPARDFDYEQVHAAVLFLLTFGRPRKTLNRKANSYILKHAVENWTKASGDYVYVSNGAFILAAILCGYRFLQRPGDRNSTLNLVLNSAMRHYALSAHPFGKPFRQALSALPLTQ